MSLQVVRFTARDADVPDVEATIASMLAAIDRARPAGVRFASYRLADGRTFVNVLELADGTENPLPGIPECRAFQQELPRWTGEPPRPQPVAVLGSYGW